MKMKQDQMVVMLLLLAVVCIMPAAIAQGSNETNSTTNQSERSGLNTTNSTENATSNETLSEYNLTHEDERETEAIDGPLGAELRYLQLERGISRNIIIGAAIVGAVKNATPDANVSSLEAILDEMESLVTEVRKAPRDGNKTEVVKQFVSLKKDATELTQKFRTESRKIINETNKAQVKLAIKEVKLDSLKDIDQKIVLARQNLNASRLGVFFDRMNVTDEHLMERVRNGSATIGEIRDGVKNDFRNLTFEQRRESINKINEQMIKRTIERKEALNKIMENFRQERANQTKVIEERLQNRTKMMNANHTTMVKSLEERMGQMGIRKPDMEQRRQDVNNLSEEADLHGGDTPWR